MIVEIKTPAGMTECLAKRLVEDFVSRMNSVTTTKDGRLYENPRYDFFEKITFEGMKGELSNPYIHRVDSDEVATHVGCQWQRRAENPRLFLDEAIEAFKKAEQFQLTRVARRDYITDLRIYSLATKENHRTFVLKHGHWFDDFVHIESQGVHTLYCFYTGHHLEVWWNKIKEELLVFPTCKIYENPGTEIPIFGRSAIG